LPTPVQKPRIPVWVAGLWPHKKPFRRAAQWDGVFPLFANPTDNTLDNLKTLIEYLRAHRNSESPYDILFRGTDLPVDDPGRAAEIIEPYEKLGVTWWQVNLNPTAFGGELKGEWPLEKMYERLLQGPPIKS